MNLEVNRGSLRRKFKTRISGINDISDKIMTQIFLALYKFDPSITEDPKNKISILDIRTKKKKKKLRA